MIESFPSGVGLTRATLYRNGLADSDSAQLWDTTARLVSAYPSLPTARSHLAAASAGGVLAVAGGTCVSTLSFVLFPTRRTLPWCW